MEMISAGMGLWEMGVGIMGAFSQKNVEEQKVKLTFESNMEDIRTRKFEQDQIQGLTKALSETAGVLHSGGSTAQGYLDVMSNEFKREIDFATRFAKRARRLGMTSADLNFKSNLMGSVASGTSSMAGSGAFG